MEYIIGIDFDGTVVTHEYPRVGRDIGAVPVLKRLVDSGNKLILFTMRDSRNGTLQDAINWFKENGIELYGVNTNPTQADWTDSPKAHCNFYIDDAALGIPKNFDWKTGSFLLYFSKRKIVTRHRQHASIASHQKSCVGHGAGFRADRWLQRHHR